jgi:hypothetical protein
MQREYCQPYESTEVGAVPTIPAITWAPEEARPSEGSAAIATAPPAPNIFKRSRRDTFASAIPHIPCALVPEAYGVANLIAKRPHGEGSQQGH